MKNIEFIKLKVFLIIFLCINSIIQPVSLYFYIVNNINHLDIVFHIFESLYLTISLAIIITEFIFKTIFFKMLKGKLIANSSGKALLAVLYLLIMVLYLQWVVFFMLEEHISTYSTGMIILIVILNSYKSYIISNGYLFCWFRVIPLETINWYRVTRKKQSCLLFIKYQGNKSLTILNSIKCIEELTYYFDTHNINSK